MADWILHRYVVYIGGLNLTILIIYLIYRLILFALLSWEKGQVQQENIYEFARFLVI